MTLQHELEGHSGCVNSVEWSETGHRLVSGSDDCDLGIWSLSKSEKVAMVPTCHERNIFGASFIPDGTDSGVVSCGMDGALCRTDLNKKKSSTLFTTAGMLMKISFVPGEPFCCLTSGEDGKVRHHDLRVDKPTTIVDLDVLPCASNLAFSPIQPRAFCVGSTDLYVRMYDVRRLLQDPAVLGKTKETSPRRGKSFCLWKFNAPLSSLAGRHPIHKQRWLRGSQNMRLGPSGIDIDCKGQVLVNYRGGDMFLLAPHATASGIAGAGGSLGEGSFPLWREEMDWRVDDPQGGDCTVVQRFRGRNNEMTFLKEARFGLGATARDRYAITGGDGGYLFVWDTRSFLSP